MTRITQIFADNNSMKNLIICENLRYPRHPCSYETAKNLTADG